MPKAIHDALVKEARKKGLKGKKFNRYVFGGLANIKKKMAGKTNIIKKRGSDGEYKNA